MSDEARTDDATTNALYDACNHVLQEARVHDGAIVLTVAAISDLSRSVAAFEQAHEPVGGSGS